MIETRIQVDNIEEVKQRLGNLSHKAPSVLANAINRTTTNIKKTMAQQTAKRYNIANGEVKKTISISKATRARLEGATISKASPIALAKFKVSPNRPVSYPNGKPSPKVYKASVEKGPASKPLDGNPKAFIAVMKNGHQGVFTRTGKWSSESSSAYKSTREYNRGRGEKAHSSHNEVIRQLFGPSVPQMIKNDESMKNIQEEAQSTLRKRIDAEIENILRKG